MQLHNSDSDSEPEPAPDPEILPWERQPGEGSPAFRAFCAFRDSGPAITTGERMLAAYNSLKPEDTRKRCYVPNEWKKWARRFEWEERVEKWDQRLDRIRQRAVENAVQQQGQLWARRQEEVREQAYELGKNMLGQAKLLSQFPVVRKTVRDTSSGAVTVWEAVGTKELKDVATIAKVGYELAGGAAAEGTRAMEQLRDTPDEPDEARQIRERSERELLEWQQRMVAQGTPVRQALEPPARPTEAGHGG